MNNVFATCQCHFDFLNSYGYAIPSFADDNAITFCGDCTRIRMLYSPFELVVEGVIEDFNGRHFAIEDAFTYINETEHRGYFQFANNDPETTLKGMRDFAENLCFLFAKIDLSMPGNFDAVWNFTQAEEDAYKKRRIVEDELREAERCWRLKKYPKAIALFENNAESLSQSQRQKLSYMKRH